MKVELRVTWLFCWLHVHDVCKWAESTLGCEAFEGLSLETSCHVSCAALEFCPVPSLVCTAGQRGASPHFSLGPGI